MPSKMLKMSFVFASCIIFLLSPSSLFSQPVKKNKRSDNYFGLHFDFHAQANDSLIGKNVTGDILDYIFREVKPDIIQVDSKGHPGYSSYPTKYGNQTKGYRGNPLEIYVKVAKKYGVPIYNHYSGLLDDRAIELHPDWAIVRADGKRSKSVISYYSPYLDSLMIPQLKEISDIGINGTWVDGDCWAVEPDYSAEAIADFKSKTGISNIPYKSTDAHYFEWIEFQRNNFKAYLLKYTNAIHKHNPAFEIASNWAYTNLMPDSVDVPFDYLSGDLSAPSTLYSAAFAGRIMAGQGLPWDLMSWRFNNGFFSPKSIIELKLEASQVVSMGGAYQLYNLQNGDASIPTFVIPDIKNISSFLRQRQPYCQGAKQVPEIALLLSTCAYKRETSTIYGGDDSKLKDIKGISMMLLDAQYNVAVTMEHQLRKNMRQYKLIVIPGWHYIEPAFKTALLEYVANGGRLLLTGPGPIGLFKNELDLQSFKEINDSSIYLSFKNDVALINNSFASVEAKDNLNSGLTRDYMPRKLVAPASFSKNYGKGIIGAVSINLGNAYQNERVDLTKDFLDSVLRLYIKDKDVEVQGSDKVLVNAVLVKGKKYIHLINMAGDHDNPHVRMYNQIPSLFNLSVSFKADKKPARVIIQPENIKVNFTYSGKRVTFKLPELKIFSVVQID